MKTTITTKVTAVTAVIGIQLCMALAQPEAFQFSVNRLQPAMPELTSNMIAMFERMHAEGRMSAEQLATNTARTLEHAQQSVDGILVVGTVTVMASGYESSETSPVPTNIGTLVNTSAYRGTDFSLSELNDKFQLHPIAQNRGSGRYSLACAQLVLANHWSPYLELESMSEGGKVRVFRTRSLGSNGSSEAGARYQITVTFTSSEQTSIERVERRYVDENNDYPVRRYDVSGIFGTPEYEVKIVHLNRDGSENEVENLVFLGTTNEYFSPNSIPLGATVVDSRGGNAVTYAWNGQLPEVNSEGDLPVALWFAAASLLCLGAGVFFWRKR
ncbi:MAG: hypothetical protein ACK4P3_09530 [Fimbriimonadaceae bacterium]